MAHAGSVHVAVIPLRVPRTRADSSWERTHVFVVGTASVAYLSISWRARPSTRDTLSHRRARAVASAFLEVAGAPSKRAPLQTSSSPSLESESSHGRQEPFREHTITSCMGGGWTVRRRGGVCRTHAPLARAQRHFLRTPWCDRARGAFRPVRGVSAGFLMAHGALPWPRMISFHIVYVHGRLIQQFGSVMPPMPVANATNGTTEPVVLEAMMSIKEDVAPRW